MDENVAVTPRTASRIAWSVPVLALPLWIVTLSLGWTRPTEIAGIGLLDPGRDLPVSLAVLAFLAVGALVASRRPENPVGWIVSGLGLFGTLSAFLYEYAVYALLRRPGALPAEAEAAWLGQASGLLAFGLLPFLFLVFPTGRLPSRRWRWVGWLSAAVIAVAVAYAVLLWPFRREAALRDIIEVAGAGHVELLRDVGGGLAFLAAIASAVSVVVRLRSAKGEERQQIKWLAYAAGVVAAGLVISFGWVIGPLSGSAEGSAIALLGERITVAGKVIAGVGLLTIPLAAALAVLRYRLYDIDLLVNRTLVYGLLSATLGVGYFGGVVLLQQAFAPITRGSDLAVVATTLGIAALFRPVRNRIQGLVDRRFYRRKYDAARALETFSARLRDEIDLDTLSRELQAVVSETMQPAHVALWLRPTERR